MGRNKYSQSEIGKIAKLLRMKCKANRLKQKEIRHDLAENPQGPSQKGLLAHARRPTDNRFQPTRASQGLIHAS